MVDSGYPTLTQIPGIAQEFIRLGANNKQSSLRRFGMAWFELATKFGVLGLMVYPFILVIADIIICRVGRCIGGSGRELTSRSRQYLRWRELEEGAGGEMRGKRIGMEGKREGDSEQRWKELSD
jgi:hypothetical protein